MDVVCVCQLDTDSFLICYKSINNYNFKPFIYTYYPNTNYKLYIFQRPNEYVYLPVIV